VVVKMSDIKTVASRNIIGSVISHFVMVPLNMTYLHCLQHSLFEHLFNLYKGGVFYCSPLILWCILLSYQCGRTTGNCLVKVNHNLSTLHGNNWRMTVEKVYMPKSPYNLKRYHKNH